MIRDVLEDTGVYLLSTHNYDKSLNNTGMWAFSNPYNAEIFYSAMETEGLFSISYHHKCLS